MPRFDVQIVLRIWISKETNAKTREEAEARILRQSEKLLNERGFRWIDGRPEVVGGNNLTLLNKIF